MFCRSAIVGQLLQRSAIGAAARGGSRGFASKVQPHLSCLASRAACTPGYCEGSFPDVSTNTDYVPLTAALVVAGAALGLAHCQVSTEIAALAAATNTIIHACIREETCGFPLLAAMWQLVQRRLVRG